MAHYLFILPLAIFLGLLYTFFFLHKKGYSSTIRVLLSLCVGIGFGLFLKLLGSETTGPTEQALQLVSSTYLSLLKMLVIPLVLTSIIQAILNLGDLIGHFIKALISRSVGMLLIMTALASAIGLGVGEFFHVGQGLQLPALWHGPTHEYKGLVDTLTALVPNNIAAAMVDENTVALVIFALLIGMSALKLYGSHKESVEPFKQFMTSAFLVTKQLAQSIISLTPYGVLALMSHMVLSQGLNSLAGIGTFVLAMYVAMILVIGMHLIFVGFFGLNPVKYIKAAYPALLVAFTTRSSFGTLPVTEETLRNRLKVDQVAATFVPSLGATMGMNACAGVFPAMLVVMVLTILHLPLTWGLFLTVMGINMIASLGISGIPGTATVAATVTLTALGLPFSIVGLVQGVDAIVDMGRTATNINGVMTTAYVVDKSLDIPETADDIENIEEE